MISTKRHRGHTMADVLGSRGSGTGDGRPAYAPPSLEPVDATFEVSPVVDDPPRRLSTRTRYAAGLTLLFLAVLVLAACGGSGDDTSSPGSTAASVSDTDAPDEPGAGSQAVTDAPGGDAQEPTPGGLGENRALVVIGDEQFEFDMSATCVSMGGAVGGTGWTADELAKLDLDIPPEDWETSPDGWSAPSIRVDDESDENLNRDWRAGGEVIANYEGLGDIARVDTFSTDGGRAFGTVTFIDLMAYQIAAASGDPLPDPVTGTFDINCG
ncbi:hypothetical protein MNBD_ACTINO02-1292 [hydrothermal vent metagenome]|uniref:Uncharacterized protein n=1 Tax=hydrothermal vent metagenome TaxID=652676 RepID=A0A3B0RPB9_9ZZZZ